MNCYRVRHYNFFSFGSLFNHYTLEIRQLNGERQSLVYNHHHELIAASDTISAVGQALRLPSLSFSDIMFLWLDENQSRKPR
jgi:hypothetical protein